MFSTTIISWLLMVLYEAGEGYHTKIVRRGLRYGVILFIVSEIMFFFSLFWAFFHFSVSPSIEIGHI
jgi:cytochrome c oxidase subunit 3